MPRRPRIEYGGAAYHVMNRGDQGDRVFFDDLDRENFLGMLGECCGRTGWKVHSYVLMKNHLQTSTMVSQRWIAERLHMGAAANVGTYARQAMARTDPHTAALRRSLKA